METFIRGIVSAISSVSPSVQATRQDACSTSRMLLGECEFETKRKSR